MNKKELQKLLKQAERKARADVLGYADTFSAVAWRKTLPKEVQPEVEEVIVRIYHSL